MADFEYVEEIPAESVGEEALVLVDGGWYVSSGGANVKVALDPSLGQDLLTQVSNLAKAARAAGYDCSIHLSGNKDVTLPDLEVNTLSWKTVDEDRT